MTRSTYENMTTAQLKRTLPYVSNPLYRGMIVNVIDARKAGTAFEPATLSPAVRDGIERDTAFSRTYDN